MLDKPKPRKNFVPPDEPLTIPQHLKGKEYSYDHQGRMVELAKVNPDRLPSSYVEPPFNIRASASTPSGQASAQSKTQQQQQAKKPAAKKSSVASALDATTIVKKEPGRFVEPVDPNAGVVVRDGNALKVGPTRERDKKHMSRKDYLSTIAVVNQQLSRQIADKLSSNTLQAMSPNQTDSVSGQDVFASPRTQMVQNQQQLHAAQQALVQTSPPRVSTSPGRSGTGSMKSRKDRSVYAPYASSGDEFAIMRKQASLMRSTLTPPRQDNGTARPGEDRTIINNPRLAQELISRPNSRA